ncbi:MAG: hypothetical protein HY318_19095 [Armatimonadetes bacterium]|nr:hypothetical protein [Armatimonadota bacterium]
MVANEREYQAAVGQLTELELRLREVERSPDHPNKGLTKAGIHKMIARLHEELAEHDGYCALAHRTEREQ